MRAALALIALILGTATATAQDEVQISIEQAGEDVYVISGGGGNITAIVTLDGIVVVDSFITPDLGRRARELIEGLERGAIRYLINTHYHYDHTFGNQHFTDAVIISHENCAARLAANALDWEGALRVLERFDDFALTAPAWTFSGSGMALHLGGKEIRLMYMGPAHTDGDTIVHVPEDGLLITGDLIFNRISPYIDFPAGADIASWISILDACAALEPVRIVVPGHGDVGVRELLSEQKRFLVDFQRQLNDLYGRGLTSEEALEQLDFAQFDDYRIADFVEKVVVDYWSMREVSGQ